MTSGRVGEAVARLVETVQASGSLASLYGEHRVERLADAVLSESSSPWELSLVEAASQLSLVRWAELLAPSPTRPARLVSEWRRHKAALEELGDRARRLRRRAVRAELGAIQPALDRPGEVRRLAQLLNALLARPWVARVFPLWPARDTLPAGQWGALQLGPDYLAGEPGARAVLAALLAEDGPPAVEIADQLLPLVTRASGAAPADAGHLVAAVRFLRHAARQARGCAAGWTEHDVRGLFFVQSGDRGAEGRVLDVVVAVSPEGEPSRVEVEPPEDDPSLARTARDVLHGVAGWLRNNGRPSFDPARVSLALTVGDYPGGLVRPETDLVGESLGVAAAAGLVAHVTGQDVALDVAATGQVEGVRILPVDGVPLKAEAATWRGLRAVVVPSGRFGLRPATQQDEARAGVAAARAAGAIHRTRVASAPDLTGALSRMFGGAYRRYRELLQGRALDPRPFTTDELDRAVRSLAAHLDVGRSALLLLPWQRHGEPIRADHLLDFVVARLAAHDLWHRPLRPVLVSPAAFDADTPGSPALAGLSRAVLTSLRAVDPEFLTQTAGPERRADLAELAVREQVERQQFLLVCTRPLEQLAKDGTGGQTPDRVLALRRAALTQPVLVVGQGYRWSGRSWWRHDDLLAATPTTLSGRAGEPTDDGDEDDDEELDEARARQRRLAVVDDLLGDVTSPWATHAIVAPGWTAPEAIVPERELARVSLTDSPAPADLLSASAGGAPLAGRALVRDALDRGVLVVGPARFGKSTLLYCLAQELLSAGRTPDRSSEVDLPGLTTDPPIPLYVDLAEAFKDVATSPRDGDLTPALLTRHLLTSLRYERPDALPAPWRGRDAPSVVLLLDGLDALLDRGGVRPTTVVEWLTGLPESFGPYARRLGVVVASRAPDQLSRDDRRYLLELAGRSGAPMENGRSRLSFQPYRLLPLDPERAHRFLEDELGTDGAGLHWTQLRAFDPQLLTHPHYLSWLVKSAQQSAEKRRSGRSARAASGRPTLGDLSRMVHDDLLEAAPDRWDGRPCPLEEPPGSHDPREHADLLRGIASGLALHALQGHRETLDVQDVGTVVFDRILAGRSAVLPPGQVETLKRLYESRLHRRPEPTAEARARAAREHVCRSLMTALDELQIVTLSGGSGETPWSE